MFVISVIRYNRDGYNQTHFVHLDFRTDYLEYEEGSKLLSDPDPVPKKKDKKRSGRKSNRGGQSYHDDH